MATSLPLERHLSVIEASGGVLVERAQAAGLDAPVPTCPAWSVAQLLAHVTMVHRWAAGNVSGEPFERTQTQIHAEEPDLVGYACDGIDHLTTTLRSAADDVQSMVFLKDAPPPRRFWTRRQAHETTIHAVDALAASLGRVPTAGESVDALAIDTALAVDGIDELVCGFMPRGRSKLATGEPFVVTIEPTDVDTAWTLRVGEERLVAEPVRPGGDDVDVAALTGTASELYLGLWNRGAEVKETGPGDVLAAWRRHQRVTWS